MASSTSEDFAGIRREFALPTQYPADALAQAQQSVAAQIPTEGREDATALPFVTIDPPGAKDLDQAMVIERGDGGGYRVHYAIADLGAFVPAGGPLDTEVRRRGQTIYLPDGNVPMHPPMLSEGAASLLPDQVRPSALWTIDCDATGELVHATVRRALVRSVAQLDYEGVQATVDAGNPHPSVALLPELGRLRRQLAVQRGALELQLPEQEAEPDGEGRWKLALRSRTDVDAWNAEISLLTGIAAAGMMLRAKVGVLRTLPEPENGAVAWLRRSATTLGIDWPEDENAAQLLSTLDPNMPAAMALFMDATRLLRGAGYTVFDGENPTQTGHAGIAAPYAHVTAPLRRLVDRFSTEICLAVSAGTAIPDWVHAALPELPKLMESSDALASKVDRACIDQVEAWVLADRVGTEFDAVVLRAEAGSAEVFIADPPVMAHCDGEGMPEGGTVTVRLVKADPTTHTISFQKV